MTEGCWLGGAWELLWVPPRPHTTSSGQHGGADSLPVRTGGPRKRPDPAGDEWPTACPSVSPPAVCPPALHGRGGLRSQHADVSHAREESQERGALNPMEASGGGPGGRCSALWGLGWRRGTGGGAGEGPA
uniref:Uncharacterized protein n=1 Tax=Myotis myotis TaxID=51298 RepID=A0A7J7QTK1_MYOMY|nr:hypothetical protein mMyoMyo1_011830 [Myotis myotis]